LLERARIPLTKEAEVVTALRNVVGLLGDLAEQFGFRDPPPVQPPREPAAPGGEPVPLDKTPVEEKKGAATKSPEAPRKELSKKEKKRAKREAGKETRSPKIEDPGAEEAPVAEEVERRAPGAEESSSPIIAGRTREDLQEEVDNYARAHPGSFGLGSIPVRGSAGRHFPQGEVSRGSERPPEPEGPPPERSERPAEERRERPRERSRSKKKKSKGEAHRQRGRDFWRRGPRR